jgi:hypothetical protein
MVEVLRPSIWKTSTCLTLPFTCPDLTTFCGLEELGLEVVEQFLEPPRSWFAGSASQTSGAGVEGVRASRGTRSHVVWRTSRSGGAPRHYWSRCVATGASAAVKAAIRRWSTSRGGLDLHVLVACEQGLEPMVPHIGE